jgi:L-cysteine S-thiosulfotransferase
MRATLTILALALGASLAAAQQRPDHSRIDATVKSAFPAAPADWQPRLAPDTTMLECSLSRNNPTKPVAAEIEARERTTIVYPADGKLMGDWKKGEALAQSGYGLRFTDYPPRSANGGNCYACHQLTRREVSYGTLGPSLSEYGKLRDYKEADIKATYEKIYNSHASFACSTMPRFGANRILTVEQIADAVALLMSPESPVNTGQ